MLPIPESNFSDNGTGKLNWENGDFVTGGGGGNITVSFPNTTILPPFGTYPFPEPQPPQIVTYPTSPLLPDFDPDEDKKELSERSHARKGRLIRRPPEPSEDDEE